MIHPLYQKAVWVIGRFQRLIQSKREKPTDDE